MASTENFDRIIEGKQVSLYTLKNSQNTQLDITNYGCRIVRLRVPDRQQGLIDAVMGFESLEKYMQPAGIYQGATVGRFANRIAKGHFHLNNHDYQLSINNPPNHLHGGPHGFATKVWEVEEVGGNRISLSYLSVDGEENYPGNLKVRVSFTLSEQNEVFISYEATTDKTTILNLTNHAFFNLNGQGSGTILHHLLQINASRFTPVDETLIPTGILARVENTPFDFTRPHPIGERIHDADIQLGFGKGYDHNYVLDEDMHKIGFAAKVTGDKTGLAMEVFTDQPGMQFYTANFMPPDPGAGAAIPDAFRSAFCLETQHFPDSPHHSNFPSTTLQPGEVFTATTIYKFSAGN